MSREMSSSAHLSIVRRTAEIHSLRCVGHSRNVICGMLGLCSAYRDWVFRGIATVAHGQMHALERMRYQTLRHLW